MPRCSPRNTRSVNRLLHGMLGALWLVVAGPSVEVAAILERVKARTARLTVLMERFDAGTLKVRTLAPRRAGPHAARAREVAPRPWPEHLGAWLAYVGMNNPSFHIRAAWERSSWNRSCPRIELMLYGQELRRMVTDDAGMQAFVRLSGEGRRVVRWLLRMSNQQKVPEILKEPARPKPPRPEGWTRRKRDRWAPPKPKRPKKPFAEPPDNMSREERVARLLPVPPPRTAEDPVVAPGTIRHNYTSR